MPFDCPDAVDYADVRALNRAFLMFLHGQESCRQWLAPLPDALTTRICSLSLRQIDRLSKTPFLLFSMRERDDQFWEALLGDGHNGDLFTSRRGSIDDTGRLTAASLGFIWQVAKRNAYTARLICGASLHWCELIAEQTIYQLLVCAGSHNDLLQLRYPSDTRFWTKLLQSGVSEEKELRLAAHLTALRTVLKNPLQQTSETWAAAACASRQPVLQVADRNTVGDKQHSI